MTTAAITIQSKETILQTMELLDRKGGGTCFIQERTKVVGVITDGDIRRGIIAGTLLNDSVTVIMNSDFFSLPINSSLDVIQKSLLKYTCIPILCSDGNLVDVVTLDRYHQIPLAQPSLDGNELEYVTDCIQTGWISSQGSYVTRFEETFGRYVGNDNTLAVSNGTVALHLALATLGVGPGDEVIVPDLTFAAVINAVLYVGATPVIVDIDERTLTLDPDKIPLALTKKTRAIVAVHLYGHPVAMEELMKIANDNDLLVVEDCAEALGSYYDGKHVGSHGDAAIFSFFGNKTITTGEGGMLQFRQAEMKERAKVLRDHGMSPSRRYWHDEMGFNYRLTNMQAAVGVAQIERVEYFVQQKRWIADRYAHYLGGVNNITLPSDCPKSINSYWLYTVILSSGFAGKRDNILESLKGHGVEARPVFFPMHQMPPYQAFGDGSNYPISTSISSRGISLPSSVNTTEEEIEHVCDRLVLAIHSANV